MKKERVLVTGVCGFIGSHLLEALLKMDLKVIGVDNFDTGSQSNLDAVKRAVGEDLYQANFNFQHGDITHPGDINYLMIGVDTVYHLAARGSVPRSLSDPKGTMDNNVIGTTNVLEAAGKNRVTRVVLASSSSVYGINEDIVKRESHTDEAKSPYAASKQFTEALAALYPKLYPGLETISLRFFNVFGERQNPTGPYAAVIPKWIKAIAKGDTIDVYGDGEQTRDFTYVSNVVQALIRAGSISSCDYADAFFPKVYNVGCGKRTSLVQLASDINQALDRDTMVLWSHKDPRHGDVRESVADISSAMLNLDYKPTVLLMEGLKKTIEEEGI